MAGTTFDEQALHPVSDAERTSKASHQFWIWAGANIAPINWVLGALGIKLGLSLADTVLVLVVGNLIGMALFGCFVLMGQRTGVSQMVMGRSAFGRVGAFLPTVLQGVIAAGWCAINTWIVLDLLLALFGELGLEGGTGLKIGLVVVIMGLQVMIAASGFRAIAAFEKWTVPVTLVVLVAMTIVAWTRLDIQWDHAGTVSGSERLAMMSAIMTAIGIGWGITWFAYASDYSRFVPRSVPARKVYTASVFGQFLPVVWLGVLGASLATVSATADPGQLIVGAFGGLAIPVILLVIHGPIATNILNVYSAALCAQTIGWRISRRMISLLVGVVAGIFTIYLVFAGDFAAQLDAWLAGLVTWVAPWAGVMLVHYYVIRRGRIDVGALFDTTGERLQAVRWSALGSFLVGILATWSFEYGLVAPLQGPIATAMNGVDLSWLAGLVVGGGLYFLTARFDEAGRPESPDTPESPAAAQRAA